MAELKTANAYKNLLTNGEIVLKIVNISFRGIEGGCYKARYKIQKKL